MANDYTYFADLVREIEPPEDGILTRTLFNDKSLKVVLFGFAANEELSEHTASKPAMLHFLQGEATVGLGGNCVDARDGTWIHMPANLKHSIKTSSATIMLLLLLK